MTREAKLIKLENLVLLKETKPDEPDEGAYLILNDEEETVWIPKKFAQWDDDTGILEIEEWCALGKGLI